MDTIERLAKALGWECDGLNSIVDTRYFCYYPADKSWPLAGRLIEEYDIDLLKASNGVGWYCGNDSIMTEVHSSPIIAVYSAVIAIKEGDSDE